MYLPRGQNKMAQKRHYSWLIDPITGDYVINKGNPVRDDTLQFPAYARLKIRRGSWMYAPNSDYGSDYSTVRKRTNTTQALLESIGNKALQPMIDDGRASEVVFSLDQSSRNGESQICSIVDTDSNILSFELPSVGV
jgi:phage gp46-like protein